MACPDHVPAAALPCPPLPSARQSASPTSLLRSTLPVQTSAPQEHRRPETCRSSTVHVLQALRDPTTQRHPPSRTCSAPLRCTALPPDEQAVRVHASAASDRLSPQPPESRHPSAPRR